ncbi:MAG: SRPBCC domain-containing protein [Actinobacteria bacterium]|nr:SRPBCC domain-containing protein [Actinomycetota bacterium]
MNTTPRHPLGRITHDDRGVSLHFERQLSHPPERVWRALTESDQLRSWFPADIVGPREAGAEVTTVFWDDVAARHSIEQTVHPARIITWDPYRTFVWLWDDELISFHLEPTPSGTTLTLVVQVGEKSPGAQDVAAGYHVCLDQLVALVDTDDPPPFLDADPGPLTVLYAEMMHEQ